MKHIDYWTVSLASVDGKTRNASEVREPEDVSQTSADSADSAQGANSRLASKLRPNQECFATFRGRFRSPQSNSQ